MPLGLSRNSAAFGPPLRAQVTDPPAGTVVAENWQICWFADPAPALNVQFNGVIVAIPVPVNLTETEAELPVTAAGWGVCAFALPASSVRTIAAKQGLFNGMPFG
jgi:hypothetical protein